MAPAATETDPPAEANNCPDSQPSTTGPRTAAVSEAQPAAQPNDINLRLIAAAGAGDQEAVRQLLTLGAQASAMDDDRGTSALMAAAAVGHTDIVKTLLAAGAPWNALNREGNCAGDLALAGGHAETAEEMLEAGVRAELVLGAAQRGMGATQGPGGNAYLQQRLSYDGEKLLDGESKGVMMAWEGPLMKAHAQAVASSRGDILNVGFGMGLVDMAIQEHQPRSHTIIEAHPDVHQRMLAEGWDKKPGVRIVFGRWQDVLGQLGKFDGIFFDTYSEYYDDLREFHQALPQLLKPDSLYSFFNGLAADNAFFHSVCCRVVAAELARMGLTTQFVPLPINVSDAETWQGVALRYWQLDTYLLPVCHWADDEDDDRRGEADDSTAR